MESGENEQGVFLREVMHERRATESENELD